MRIEFLGSPLDIVSWEDLLAKVTSAISSRKGIVHCSLNALKVVEARKDSSIKTLLSRFDLITADGMSVVWGLRLLGRGRVKQIAGVELMEELLRVGSREGWKFFLLGAEPSILGDLQSCIRNGFPGVRIVGIQHGYFSRDEERAIAGRIGDSGADILFVGMPSPAKEKFILNYRDSMRVPFAMGVGGGLDILAGKTRRAPLWMRRSGLEWLFRVLQEPRRLAGRYLSTNLRFAALLFDEMLNGRRSRKEASC